MAQQTPEPTTTLHHSPSAAEEEAQPPPPPASAAVLEEAVEPPFASADIEVPAVSAPAAAPAEQPVVTVVEKEAPLSLAQPAAGLAEEKVSVTTLTEPQEESDFPRPVPPPGQAEAGAIEPEKTKPVEVRQGPFSFASFKEESNIIVDLSNPQRKALEDFKSLVQDALKNHSFTTLSPHKAQEIPSASSESAEKSEITSSPEEVSIWGIPFMKDDRTDVILLKFLRARDFDVGKAFAMLRNTIIWRKEYNIDGLIDEELGDDLEKVVFMHGHDKHGHPVCYNVYGEFQNKELYNKTFADEEKRKSFLRWRIQFLERSIRKLDFRPDGINTIFQISDLKNSPGPGKKELRIATRQALQLLQDNYPEFVAKQVFFILGLGIICNVRGSVFALFN